MTEGFLESRIGLEIKVVGRYLNIMVGHPIFIAGHGDPLQMDLPKIMVVRPIFIAVLRETPGRLMTNHV